MKKQTNKKTKLMSYDEILKCVLELSPRELRKINTAYLQENKGKLDKRIDRMSLLDLETRVKELGINSCCPKCNSKLIVKAGKHDNGLQRLRCTECGTRFGYLSGTFLEKSKHHYDVWVQVIYEMLNYKSIEDIRNILINDLHCVSIQHSTVFEMRHVLFNAAMNVEPVILEGVVQIDETYIHEAQKASKSLINPLQPNENRCARKTGSSAQYGCLSPEFCNCIAAVDENNHVIVKYVGAGACKANVFEELFHPYIKNAAWLCTDANALYSSYCSKYGKNHYVRPSNYGDNLTNGLAENKTEKQLYQNGMLDYIDLNGRYMMPFAQFKELKKELGLNLGRVNAIHNLIKLNLVKKTHGINAIHLPGYLAWFCLLQNFAADYGHKPSSKKDAEEIFEILLKTKAKIKVKEISKKKPDFSNISTQYRNNLIKATVKLQEKANNCTRVLTPEDATSSFNTRKYLEELPLYQLKFLLKRCNIKGRAKVKDNHRYAAIRALEVHSELEDAIAEMRAEYPTYQEQ